MEGNSGGSYLLYSREAVLTRQIFDPGPKSHLIIWHSRN